MQEADTERQREIYIFEEAYEVEGTDELIVGVSSRVEIRRVEMRGVVWCGASGVE